MILFMVWKEYWKAIKRLEKKYQQCLGDMLSLMGVTMDNDQCICHQVSN